MRARALRVYLRRNDDDDGGGGIRLGRPRRDINDLGLGVFLVVRSARAGVRAFCTPAASAVSSETGVLCGLK